MGKCETRTPGSPSRALPGRKSARMVLAAVAAACVASITMGFAGPAPALAGSGNFCTSCDLNAHSHDIGNYRGHFYETETWNSDGKGVGSCSGVGTSGGSYATVACHGDASGYNEVYCTACNGDTNWYAIMENNSNHGYNSVFTGWEWYA
jgi:hypothetical protein